MILTVVSRPSAAVLTVGARGSVALTPFSSRDARPKDASMSIGRTSWVSCTGGPPAGEDAALRRAALTPCASGAALRGPARWHRWYRPAAPFDAASSGAVVNQRDGGQRGGAQHPVDAVRIDQAPCLGRRPERAPSDPADRPSRGPCPGRGSRAQAVLLELRRQAQPGVRILPEVRAAVLVQADAQGRIDRRRQVRGQGHDLRRPDRSDRPLPARQARCRVLA